MKLFTTIALLCLSAPAVADDVKPAAPHFPPSEYVVRLTPDQATALLNIFPNVAMPQTQWQPVLNVLQSQFQAQNAAAQAADAADQAKAKAKK